MSQEALERINKEKQERTGTLDLHSTRLIAIPEEVKDMIWLTKLGLDYNLIKDIHFIEKLTNLKTLDLSSNQISDIHFLRNLTGLQSLFLSSNLIKDIRILEKLSKLHSLHLNSNQISNIRFLERLTNLQTLDLSNNPIDDILSLSKLTNLKNLDIESNQISDIVFLKNLHSLQTLDIQSNQITDINALEKLTCLHTLALNNNHINDISVLEKLNGLYSIDLSNNHIKNIGPLMKLTKLREINLSNNNIRDLTPLKAILARNKLYIRLEKNRADIQINNNPILIPPIEIIKQGRDAILKYFDELEKGKDYLYEAKLLIVGDGRVGKTTLEKKFQNENAELPTEEETTFGVDIDKYEFRSSDGNVFTVNIWDFGGQKKYYPAHQFFLTRRSFYLLVDDASRDDINLDFWLQAIEVLSDKSPIILVQNKKTDRIKRIDDRGLLARYPNIVKFFAFNFSLPGESDKKELRKLKKEIEHQIQQLPQIGQELPKQWVKIREDLNKKAKNHFWINQQDYFDICANRGIVDKDRALLLSSYLHDLGIFLHYQDDAILRKTVILQNEWATHGVYKVLDDKNVDEAFGKFSQKDAEAIWSKTKYEGMHFELLALMHKFELCYKLPYNENNEYITTLLLPVAQPKYNWDKSNNLQLFYRYDFMPKGLISRFIVRMNRYIKEINPLIWRRGVVMERSNTQAEIIESYGSKKIDIRIKGMNCKELMTLIVDNFDDLNESFNLKVPKYVPCICDVCNASDKPHFYLHDNLQLRKEKGKETVECDVSFDDVSVIQLIDNVFTDIETIDKSNNNESCGPLNVFISYSKADKNVKKRLKTVLHPLAREGKINIWDDSHLIPAEDWDEDIRIQLQESDVILCLVTIDFLGTDYIWKTELELAKTNNITILPVIVDFCNWTEHEVLSKRSALPKKGVPIKSQEWETEAQAWTEVEKGIRRLME
jgi:small GTP-binding protein